MKVIFDAYTVYMNKFLINLILQTNKNIHLYHYESYLHNFIIFKY